MHMTPNARILIVHDDPAAGQALTGCLQDMGHTVYAVVSSDGQAVEEAADRGPGLALIDLEQDARGIGAAERIAGRSGAPVVYLVGDVDEDVLGRARTTGPSGYVLKPFADRQLRLSIDAALALHEQAEAGRERQRQAAESVDSLSRQKHAMETVLNSIGDGVIAADERGQFTLFNTSAEHIVGRGPTRIASDQWSDKYGLFRSDQVTPFPADELPLARAVRGEAVDDVDLFVRNPERPEGVHIVSRSRPLRDPDGVLHGGVTVFRNVTHMRETEQQLRQTAEQLETQNRLMEAVFARMNDGVVAVDQTGKPVVFNSSAIRILGIEGRGDKIAEWRQHHHLFRADGATPLPREDYPLANAMRGNAVNDLHLFVHAPSAEKGTHINVTAQPLRDDEGRLTGAFSVVRDISRIMEAERQLQETLETLSERNALMDAVFNSISDGVVVADAAGNLTMNNASAERLVGMGIQPVETEEWAATYGTFLPDQVTPALTGELPLARAIRGVPSDEVDLFIRNAHRPDGVFISVNGRPMRDSAGNLSGGVITFRDATQRFRSEEAMERAFAQGRLEVIDTVLHNIGNAINSVAVAVDTLYERYRDNRLLYRLTALADQVAAHQDDWSRWSSTDPQGRKAGAFIVALARDFAAQNDAALATARRAHDRVRHIVDVIRAQGATPRGGTERTLVVLRQAINDAIRVLHESLSTRGIDVAVDCARAPDEIATQESGFQQMMVNIIKNAIEAIDEQARVESVAEPRIRIVAATEQPFVVIDVTDNGAGIDKEQMRSIFTAGYTTKATGSGLGLHSAANFIVGSGGHIEPSSEGAGRGTTIRVKLPLDGEPRRGAPHRESAP